MSASPFVHRFQTNRNRYVYDVSSNAIVRVDEVGDSIFETGRSSDPHRLINKFEHEFGHDRIVESRNRMRELAADGITFSGKRPVGLTPVLCETHLVEQLRHNLRQLILNVTDQCNLRCRYCTYSGNYAGERVHSNRFMSLETAEAALRLLFERCDASERVAICFYGGEPLLNMPVIERAIELTEQECPNPNFTFHVDTNGILLSPSLIDYFRLHKVFVQVSLDGPRHIHDRYRTYANGNPTHGKVMRNLNVASQLDPDYYDHHYLASVTVAPPYELDDIRAYFDELSPGFNVLKVNFVNTYGCDFSALFGASLASFNPAETFAAIKRTYIEDKSATSADVSSAVLRDMFQNTLLRIHRRELGPIREYEHPNGTCVPGQRRLLVDTDGTLRICERVGYSGQIGTAQRGIDLDRVQHLVRRYIELSEPDCIHCWAVRLCGLCYTSILENGDMNLNRKRRFCEAEKSKLHDSLVMYAEIMERNCNAFDYMADLTID